LTYNDTNHSSGSFTAHKPSTTKENDNGHWNGSDCERELSGTSSRDQHEKLDCEAQEEKEIKFQQGDVDLIRD
jgi:hypothetical protein